MLLQLRSILRVSVGHALSAQNQLARNLATTGGSKQKRLISPQQHSHEAAFVVGTRKIASADVAATYICLRE